MSLIHEALKRVEARKDPPDDPPTFRLAPSDTSAPPEPAPASPAAAPRPQEAPESPPPSPGLLRRMLRPSASAIALGAIAAMTFPLISMSWVRHQMSPSSAPPAATTAKPAAQTLPPKVAEEPADEPAEEPLAVGEAEATATETPTASLTVEADRPTVIAPEPPPVPPDPLAEAPETPSPAPAKPARPVYSDRPPKAAAGLKVTGIMHSPTGGAALINGRMVHVGQSIDGVKLIGTTPNTVEMEVDNVRFSLGIQP